MARDSKMPNIAIMQISTYFKRLGHNVDWYNPIVDFLDTDELYESVLFDFTPPFEYYPAYADIFRGGTGINLPSRLPPEIEEIRDLDYSLYPAVDYSMQFYSRGCIRKCPFCVVPEKEGAIRSVTPFRLNPNGKHIEILDNNFFAAPDWRAAVEDIKATGQRVKFHGIDARIIDEEQIDALATLKHEGRIHVAWDFPEIDVRPQLREITKRIIPRNIMVYVLIGYNSTPEEDLFRVEALRELGITPFVMPYNKRDKYQRRFAGWVNRPQIFNSTSWEDFDRSKWRREH
jgi:radical SAM superfamily enzyme YgiQ (UPF0313 family)